MQKDIKRQFFIDFLLFFGVAVNKSAASAASPEGLQAEKLDFQGVIKSAASAASLDGFGSRDAGRLLVQPTR